MLVNVMLIPVIISLMTNACALAIEFRFKHVNPDLQPYLKEYKELLNKYCPKGNYNYKDSAFYIVDFDDLQAKNTDRVIGQCTRKINGFSVEFDKGYWYNELDNNIELRRQLVFHELTHCFLGKDHVNDPKNYMFPELDPVEYKVYLQQTIQDIKARCGQK